MLFKADRHGNTMTTAKISEINEINKETPVHASGSNSFVYFLCILCSIFVALIIGSILVRVIGLPIRLVVMSFLILGLVAILGMSLWILTKGYYGKGLIILLCVLIIILAEIWIESIDNIRLALFIGATCILFGAIVRIVFVRKRQTLVPPNTIIIQTSGKDDKNAKQYLPGTKFVQPLNTKTQVILSPQRHIKNKVICFSRDEKSFEVSYSMYWQVDDEASSFLHWSKSFIPVEELMKDIADGMIGFQISRRTFSDVRSEYDRIRIGAENATKIYLMNDLKFNFITFRLFLREISSQPPATSPTPKPPNVIGGDPAPKPPPDGQAKPNPQPQNNATKA